MKHHAFHPEADAEYAGAAAYYTKQGGPDLGGRFYDDIEQVIAEIATNPGLFRQYDPPVRRNLARDFPFAVVYLNEPDRVWILAVMPLRRHPDYWKHRLGE